MTTKQSAESERVSDERLQELVQINERIGVPDNADCLKELQQLRAVIPQVRQVIELASKTECFRRMPCLSCDGKQVLALLEEVTK